MLRRKLLKSLTILLLLPGAGLGGCGIVSPSAQGLLVRNQSPQALIVFPWPAEVATRLDPAPEVEVAANTERVVPPSGVRRIEPVEPVGSDDVVLFFYRVVDSNGYFAGAKTISARHYSAADSAVVVTDGDLLVD